MDDENAQETVPTPADETADTKLEKSLRSMARDFLMPAIDHSKADRFEEKILLDRITGSLMATARMLDALLQGELFYPRPAPLRRDLESTFHLTASLMNRLNGLDH